MNTFLYGVANRGASIRIPRDAEREQKGYFEDRRPAANADPYVVTSKIFKTTMLDACVVRARRAPPPCFRALTPRAPARRPPPSPPSAGKRGRANSSRKVVCYMDNN